MNKHVTHAFNPISSFVSVIPSLVYKGSYSFKLGVFKLLKYEKSPNTTKLNLGNHDS